MKQIRHHQQRIGPFERGGVFHRIELEKRVQLHELHAGLLEDLLARDDLGDGVDHAVGARVAVVMRVADKLAVAVEQGVVDAPGIDAERGGLMLGGLAEAGLHVVEQAQHVPVQRAQRSNAGIAEAVQFGKREAVVLEGAENGAAALSAEVDGEVAFSGQE